MKRLLIPLLFAPAIVYSQDIGLLEKTLHKKFNEYRIEKGLDTLVFSTTEKIHDANVDYSGELAYAEDSVEADSIEASLDSDIRLAPYCIALTMSYTNFYELKFTEVKDFTEYDIVLPDGFLNKRDIKEVYGLFMKDTTFLRTISVGDSLGKSRVTRRISIASGYKIDKFRTLKEGKRKNKYICELVYVVNIILYLKET